MRWEGVGWVAVNTEGRTSGLYRKLRVHRMFLWSPILDLKLVMHVKNIQVVFILSSFKFISNAAAKGLPRETRFPGVFQC